jgi:hypothetical protein
VPADVASPLEVRFPLDDVAAPLCELPVEASVPVISTWWPTCDAKSCPSRMYVVPPAEALASEPAEPVGVELLLLCAAVLPPVLDPVDPAAPERCVPELPAAPADVPDVTPPDLSDEAVPDEPDIRAFVSMNGCPPVDPPGVLAVPAPADGRVPDVPTAP